MTKFEHIGAHAALPGDRELLFQWMTGSTVMGPVMKWCARGRYRIRQQILTRPLLRVPQTCILIPAFMDPAKTVYFHARARKGRVENQRAYGIHEDSSTADAAVVEKMRFLEVPCSFF